jgi:hypothetical protein
MLQENSFVMGGSLSSELGQPVSMNRSFCTPSLLLLRRPLVVLRPALSVCLRIQHRFERLLDRLPHEFLCIHWIVLSLPIQMFLAV